MLRIDYGKPSDADGPREWLWKYVEAAKTAGELYGRTLVVIAAERYALRMVVPSSQQHSPIRWPSRKGVAEKALTKLVAPHLPATLKQLEKAVAKANASYEAEQQNIRAAQHAAAITARHVDDESAEAVPAGEGADVAELEDHVSGVGADGGVYSDADPGL